MFSYVAHPVDKVATIRKVRSFRCIVARRNVVYLSFNHVTKEIFCFNTEYLVNRSLCNAL